MKNPLRRPLPYRYFYATFAIMAINVVVYLACRMVPSLTQRLGLSIAGTVGYGWWYELVTYMFTHSTSGITHILFNMLGLLIFGVPVERSIGSPEFCLMYLVCGVLNGLLSLAFNFALGMYGSVLIGASGMVYSLLLVYAVLFPRSVISIWGIIPVPAPLLIGLYAVIELVSQVFSSSGVAHFAHLFGFAAAWLYLVVRMGIHPLTVWKDAWRR